MITGGREGGGAATWEFYPHNPIFFLTACLPLEDLVCGPKMPTNKTQNDFVRTFLLSFGILSSQFSWYFVPTVRQPNLIWDFVQILKFTFIIATIIIILELDKITMKRSEQNTKKSFCILSVGILSVGIFSYP